MQCVSTDFASAHAKLGKRRRTRIAVEVGLARTLAADGEPGRIERAYQRRRAVRTEVDGAARDAAALLVVDAHREVVAINERN